MEKLGLVFGGGGAKGSYEIGVWTALRQMNLERRISGVSGASIGALNMALFAQGDLETAQMLWSQITTQDVVKCKPEAVWDACLLALAFLSGNQNAVVKAASRSKLLREFGWGLSGILTQEKIRDILQEYVSPQRILESQLDLYACCFDIKNWKPEYFSIQRSSSLESLSAILPSLGTLAPPVRSILLASAAIPGAFDSVTLDGKQYYDGGLADNVPIRPLYQNGYRNLIVVNLNPDKTVDLSPFADANFWIITPSNRQIMQGGTLRFNPSDNQKRMQAGYEDTLLTIGS